MKRPMFDEHGRFIDDGSPICLGGVVKGGTPKFKRMGASDFYTRCEDKSSPIAAMTRDKAMFKTITEGNASDKSMKKDAEIIQRSHHKKRKEEQVKERRKPIEAKKLAYRKRWKCEPT